MMADDQEDHYAGISFGDFSTYIRNKKRKLQDQLDEVAARAPNDLPQIFEGVVFYINGFTVPPIHEIRDMMVLRGGEYRQHLSKSQITHIIAMNLTQAKMNEFKNYKVVRPEWVLDCIKAGMRLPWHRYSVLRVAGSLQQFGTRLVATASKQAPSLIGEDTRQSRSQQQRDVSSSLTSCPSATDLVPTSLPEQPLTSSLVPPPFPSEVDHPSSDESSPEDDEIELMQEDDQDIEWDDINLDGLDEPLSLSPAAHEKGQVALVTINGEDAEGNGGSISLHKAEGPKQQHARETPPSAVAAASHGLPGPGSNIGFNLIRVRRPHITPSPIGSLEGETQESFTELSFSEDAGALPLGSLTEAEAEPGAQTEVTSAISSSGGVDNRHPTLIELSNAWNRKNSSVEPGFVAKFFQSSRLHYLSTWKAKLREMMVDIQKKDSKVTQAKLNQQSIMHIDFDCFFASVGTRDRPDLAGKPVGVAHGSGSANSNSEIASCNYLARGFGVKNGMQLKKARTLCPDLVVVPYEFEKYEAISLDFYRILLQYADDLQAVSVDEALVDISSRVLPMWNDEYKTRGCHITSQGVQDIRISPEEFAQKLRNEIFKATGCQASVGIGPNILLAKLSTKRAKPHGQYIWPSAAGSDRTIQELQGDENDGSQQEEAAKGVGLGMANMSMDATPIAPATLSPGDSEAADDASSAMPPPPPPRIAPVPRPKEPRQGTSRGNSIKLLPGVGYRTAQELEERFLVKTIFELQQIERPKLQEYCGMKTGDMLFKACRGIDDTQITADLDKKRQSVSAEISWGVRFENEQQLELFIQDLSLEVSRRLRDIGRKAKSLIMKIMKRKPFVQGAWKHLGHGPVDQYARTGQLPNYTDDPDVIAEVAMKLIRFFKFSPLDLRGLGIQMVKLDHGPQGSLASNSILFDPVQQTTLAAMFSKQRVAIEEKQERRLQQLQHGEQLVVSAQTDPDSAGMETDQQQIAGPSTARQSSPASLPEMEIDRATFEELPEDIQRELSRNHQLKFLDCENAAVPAVLSTPPHPQLQCRPPTDSHTLGAPVQQEDDQHPSPSAEPQVLDRPSLPPWSQLDPDALQAMSTPMIRKTLELYADDPRRRNIRGHPDGLSVSSNPNVPAVRPPFGSSQEQGKVLPSPSKLDMSVLRELPDDIRAEIEKEYNVMQENQRLIQALSAGERSRGSGVNGGESSVVKVNDSGRGGSGGVGSSTSNNRATNAAPTSTTTGRRRGRPLGARNKRQHHHDDVAQPAEAVTTVVENGLPGDRGNNVNQEHQYQEEGIIPPLDPEFLAALPPDLRAEVEANHQADVLRHRQRVQQLKKNQKKKITAVGGTHSGQSINHSTEASTLSRQDTRPSFDNDVSVSTSNMPQLRPTLDGEREIGPLREMVTMWVSSTLVEMALPGLLASSSTSPPSTKEDSHRPTISIQVDKGPNPEDVSDFIEFLVRVIAMERDLDRVRLLVRWLRRKVAESEVQLIQNQRRASMMLQGRLSEEEEEEEGEDDAEEKARDSSLSSTPLAALLNLCSQPAMTWRQAQARIETAVQSVVRQMYNGTLDFTT